MYKYNPNAPDHYGYTYPHTNIKENRALGKAFWLENINFVINSEDPVTNIINFDYSAELWVSYDWPSRPNNIAEQISFIGQDIDCSDTESMFNSFIKQIPDSVIQATLLFMCIWDLIKKLRDHKGWYTINNERLTRYY